MPDVNWLYFDIETERAAHEVGGWHNIEQLGVACTVTHSSKDNAFRVYRKTEILALLDELRAADCLVGFNSIGFDLRVLQTYADFDLRSIPHVDLMVDIKKSAGFRVGLNNCCEATFGEKKSSNGLEALQWWREGRQQEVINYCKQDVALTRRLHEYGAQHGWIRCREKNLQLRTIPINWRLEAPDPPAVQGSLFD